MEDVDADDLQRLRLLASLHSTTMTLSKGDRDGLERGTEGSPSSLPSHPSPTRSPVGPSPVPFTSLSPYTPANNNNNINNNSPSPVLGANALPGSTSGSPLTVNFIHPNAAVAATIEANNVLTVGRLTPLGLLDNIPPHTTTLSN